MGVPVADSPAEQVQRTGAASLITKMTDKKENGKFALSAKLLDSQNYGLLNKIQASC